MSEPWWSEWPRALVPYAVLLRAFVDGRLGAEEFEAIFLPHYRDDPTLWAPAEFDILDSFFVDVDDFLADPELRREVHGLDENELRRSAAKTLDRLSSMVSAPPDPTRNG
jgi:hypothetical protein